MSEATKILDETMTLLQQLDSQIEILSLIANKKPIDKYPIRIKRAIKGLEKIRNEYILSDVKKQLDFAYESLKEKE